MTTTNSNQQKYYLVFSGKIKKGAEPRIVKQKLIKFFGHNAKKVEQLLLKGKNVLKKDLSKQDAEKFKFIFEATGAKCTLHVMPKNQKRHALPPARAQKIKRQPANQQTNNPHVDDPTNNNKKDDPRIDDLIKVTQFLVKVINFNQKMIWTLITLVTMSIAGWGWLLLNLD